MAGRFLTSYYLGFLLLTQTYASPIPLTGYSTTAPSGTGQTVATTSDAAAPGDTAGAGTSTGAGQPGATTSDATSGDATYPQTPGGAQYVATTPDGTSGGATSDGTPPDGTATSDGTTSGDATQGPSSSTDATSPPSTSPGTTASSTSPDGSTSTCSSTTYTIVEGDTCEVIAEKNSVSTILLMNANSITDGCHSLHPGDTLCIPEKCHAYKAKTGDTCSKLAAAITKKLHQMKLSQDVTVAMFQKWNQ